MSRAEGDFAQSAPTIELIFFLFRWNFRREREERHMKRKNRMALGYLITVLGGVCWAVGGACGQTLFEKNNITSDWLVPIRLLIAGSVMVLCAQAMGKRPLAVWKERKNYPALLVFGLIGSALCQYSYYTSIQYSNAAFATVLSYTAPVIILLYTAAKEHRLPRSYELLAVVLVALGAFACATQFNLGALHIAPPALFWGLMSAVAFAFYTLTPQKLIREYSLLPIVGWGMLIGGVVLFLARRPWTIAVTVDGPLFLMMSGVIVLGTICSFCFYQTGVGIVGGLAGSILSAVEPVTSVVISVLLLHVFFSGSDLAGFAMILAAIPLVAIGEYWTDKHKAALKSVRSAK